MATKRSHTAMNAPPEDEEPVDPSDELLFLALGGGNEVGRSCHIIQYKGKTVMLDAGIHPAKEGLDVLPYYDDFDLSQVDILLITHFHMDHSASLPYVLSKTNFAGKVYMTHPTKAIYKWMMQDSVRVQNTHTASSGSSDAYVNQLFNEQDILSTLPLINTVSFHTSHTVNGIRFTPYPAGHVLGACMYLIEIAGLKVLFTGDYSRENDRHLIPASLPANVGKIDCLITESTFGISTHIPRAERETALMKSITGILQRGGRALLPVPAIGNAQELMLILEDYWQRHEDYRRFPIYYASALARKCMVVYQTYIEAMNQNIRAKFQASQAGTGSGPWDFRYIRSLKGLDKFEDVGGCVMLASPGMLQNGVSRSLLERWAPDAKNGVVITGYNVEGTMARTIQTEPDSIPAVMTANQAQRNSLLKRPGAQDETTMIPRRCTVQEFSFAAHVDGQENREFIEEVGAEVVILVHGEKHNMGRLRSRLLTLNKFKVYSPTNCDEVRIPFRREKIARVVGRLASQVQPPTLLPSPPESDGDQEGESESKKMKEEGQVVSGVLVQNDFKLSLMAPEDLREYAGLTTTTIMCRQRLHLAAAGVELIRWALEGTFGTVTVVSDDRMNGIVNGSKQEEDADEEIKREGETKFEVMGGAVRLTHHPNGEVEIEWEGNAANDGIADAVMAVLLTIESSPAAVKQSSKMHNHSHEQQRKSMDYDAFGDSPVATRAPNGGFEKALSTPEEALGKNPFANVDPAEKLNRLFMFLEAQFGEDAITPIAQPKLPATNGAVETNGSAEAGNATSDATSDGVSNNSEQERAAAAELERLHALGIPVPGVEIKVDSKIAKVWLEELEVECASKILKERVGRVVLRAMETVAPLWQ